MSSRTSYGDDAISYVQVKRKGNICSVKCKICPEHKVHAKLNDVILIVDEDEGKVTSVQCHDCVAAQGLCKHPTALFIGSPMLPSNYTVLEKISEEGKKRNLSNCELLKHQHEYNSDELFSVSMHQMVFKYKTESSDLFLSKVNLTVINMIEAETRDQFRNNL
ncbi:hypothetical protein HHI36_007821 [Cryptolaemus montrouzieri]|uniref:Uncharacterized protein n=1 Tax=Cryptolaemus montrouzieri TaxID=559131 RepID=A0ABD2MQK4_9CUCU